LLGITEPFLHELTATVVDHMGEAYHELRPAAGTVAEATRGEEERFIATLDQGLPILNDMLSKVKASGQRALQGTEIFKLYDTYGFPMDLIAEACREQGVTLDETGFEAAIEEQRTRARKTGGFESETARPVLSEVAARAGATSFVGYDRLESEGVVQALLKGDRLIKEAREGDEIELVLDVTPFYAEGGGQAGDQGVLTGTDGRVEIRETTRPVPTLIVHKGVVTSGQIREGERLQLLVNPRTRQDAARNHTATHLVHAALRDLLGPHVKQYGSLVAPNRLRFDFAHFRPMSSRDIDEIESIVNEQVRQDQPVQTAVMGVQDAVAAGALAFFGDKYGDQVRVVQIDTFSKELCGGTHCRRTGEIGLFRIVSESGVAAGVRRIECLTGSGALDSLKRLEADVRELSDLLKVAPAEVVARTRKLTEQLKDKERELADVKLKMASTSSGDAQARAINGVQVHTQRTDGLDVNGMRALADQLRDKLRSGVVALGAANDGKVSLLVVVTKDLVGRLKAGELIKEMAVEVGGTGGGRPEMAQAGGKNPEGLNTALEKVFGLVQKALEG
jgi:alanyl-tRNA synthetase